MILYPFRNPQPLTARAFFYASRREKHPPRQQRLVIPAENTRKLCVTTARFLRVRF